MKHAWQQRCCFSFNLVWPADIYTLNLISVLLTLVFGISCENWFIYFLLQSEKFFRNASLLESGRIQQTAAMLANATLHTEKFYGSDVKVAYRLTQSLLRHESSQQGFNLTATQDIHFTEVNNHVTSNTRADGEQEQSSVVAVSVHKTGNRRPVLPGWTSQPVMLYLQGVHHTSFHSLLWHPVTLNSCCFLTESGPSGQRHPVSRHTAALGADPAHGGRYGGTPAPLRGICKHAGAEHEEDLPQPLHHCHTKHRFAIFSAQSFQLICHSCHHKWTPLKKYIKEYIKRKFLSQSLSVRY